MRQIQYMHGELTVFQQTMKDAASRYMEERKERGKEDEGAERRGLQKGKGRGRDKEGVPTILGLHVYAVACLNILSCGK